jgi:hypothetical protein
VAAEEKPLSELVRRALFCPDRRSLALGRIAIGLVLLGDLARYAASPVPWFDEQGPLPSALFTGSPHVFSLLLISPGRTAVAIVFGAAALFDLAVLVGYRTRIAQFLALLMLVSIQSRIGIATNGGDRMLCILCFWTLFLPMGDFFSVDARRRVGAAPPTRAGPTLAYFAVLLQLSAAYLINSLRKTDNIWVNGTALSNFLRDPTLTSTLGCAIGHAAPPWILQVFTRAARVIEYVAPFLILSPLMTRAARNIAIVLLVGLHLGIALTLNVGSFSYAMMAYFPMLLVDEDWIAIGRVGERIRVWLGRRSWGRSLVERWDGLAVPRPTVSDATPSGPVSRGVAVAREAVVAAFLLACIARGFADNQVIASGWQPRWFAAMIEYPRLFQSWAMFVGENQFARTVLVDAETADGRHVDPLAEVAAPDADEPRPWARVPRCMNTDAFVQSYLTKFATRRRAVHAALGAWVLRYAERTGRPDDRIVAYSIYLLTQRIVAIGPEGPPVVERFLLLQYPEPVRTATVVGDR